MKVVSTSGMANDQFPHCRAHCCKCRSWRRSWRHDRPSRYSHYKVQMKIGPNKTKLMTNIPNGVQRDIKIKGQMLEAVENFKYMGSTISNEGCKPEILSRIAQTTTALSILKIISMDKLLKWSSCRRSSYLPPFMPVRAEPWQTNSKEGSKPRDEVLSETFEQFLNKVWGGG